MDDWRHWTAYAEARRRDILVEAEQERLMREITSQRRGRGRLARAVLTLAIILMGMIAWWGR